MSRGSVAPASPEGDHRPTHVSVEIGRGRPSARPAGPSAAATTRHLQPELDAHHLVFGGVEMDVGSGWELGLALGHCLTGREPWLVRSIIGYGF